jgi:hypothetical protein
VELTKDQMLWAKDLTIKEVKVPEWGGEVYVRMMDGDQRDKFEADQIANPHSNVRARLVAATVCDSAGNLLFTDADIPVISKKAGAALDRIFAASAKHSRITPADIDELKKAS